LADAPGSWQNKGQKGQKRIGHVLGKTGYYCDFVHNSEMLKLGKKSEIELSDGSEPKADFAGSQPKGDGPLYFWPAVDGAK